jgi:uncharacterized protein (TIGR02996 family)
VSHNPFPDPAAVLPGEAAMLAAVLANLTDDLPKLVYADWLEERGDERGVFLREFTTAARNGKKLPKPKKLSESWLDLVGYPLIAIPRERGVPLPRELSQVPEWASLASPESWASTPPEHLLRDALPALTFSSEKAKDSTLPVVVRRFGGGPDVPPKFKWPKHERGGPFAFLAQFNLAELSVSPAVRELPSSGLLSVFSSASHHPPPRWSVYHFPTPVGLARQSPPAGLKKAYRSPPCQLTFSEVLVLPERYERFMTGERGDFCTHLLLGHTRWIQGEPAWATETKKGRPKYRHLLTLDSDEQPGWMFGDMGSLYFGISADDLKAGRFDRTVFEIQCS